MYELLGTVTLRSGEVVEAGVVKGPEPTWSERLTKLLLHKGEPWHWQNTQFLERELGIDAYFYLLHRAGIPFANIMTAEVDGVGHFGHVWTEPADRQQGASSQLMALQMAHFRDRGGAALYLGTGYESVAYRMYQRFGFASIEAESGYMAYYTEAVGTAGDRAANFYERYFASPMTGMAPEITIFGWRDWVTATPLLMGDFPGMVRCAPWGMIGRHSPEGYLLEPLLDAERNGYVTSNARLLAARHPEHGTVVGLAGWHWHPLWPGSCLVDLYCHPTYWAIGETLLATLTLPKADRILAYVDNGSRDKVDLLMAQGFHPITTLPNFVARNARKSSFSDVTVLQHRESVGA